MRCADLNGYVLRNINLREADLEGASFAYANLSWADLRGANLEEADMRRAILDGTCLADANLKFVWLSEAHLHQATLTGAVCYKTKLRPACLAGVDLLPMGDFAWYDHVLTNSLMLDNVPACHRSGANASDIDTLFRIGRGRTPTGEPAAAEMTKWFNTNYHYMVPEFTLGQQFRLGWTQLLDEMDEALALGHRVKQVLLGPVSYLWLGKVKGEAFDRLSLLPALLPVYRQVLGELAKRGVDWVQIDELALVLELPQAWREAYRAAAYRGCMWIWWRATTT